MRMVAACTHLLPSQLLTHHPTGAAAHKKPCCCHATGWPSTATASSHTHCILATDLVGAQLASWVGQAGGQVHKLGTLATAQPVPGSHQYEGQGGRRMAVSDA